MSYPKAFNLPVGALVKVACVDDHLNDNMYGAYGIVVGTCKYTGYTEERDAEGDRYYDGFNRPVAGYTLCMVTGGMYLEHTLKDVSQRFVNLVKPGDLEADLKSHMKYRHAHVRGVDKFKYQLEQLIEREEYARECSFRWEMMYKGVEYPGKVKKENEESSAAM